MIKQAKHISELEIKIDPGNEHALLVQPAGLSCPVTVKCVRLVPSMPSPLLFVCFYNQLSIFELEGHNFEQAKAIR